MATLPEQMFYEVASEVLELERIPDDPPKEITLEPEVISPALSEVTLTDSTKQIVDNVVNSENDECNAYPVEMNQVTTNDMADESMDSSSSNSKRKKRVYFPADGNLVSGYMDPPSPWNDVSKCSTDELVRAYRASCERFGVKPVPLLLQQLQAISDFSERNETLTLKGERMDYRHCETLEEVLRRVQFRTMDLEGTGLEDEGAVAVFDMIEHYQSCLRLNLSSNRGIGLRGWQACARLMKKAPCLENLEVRNCSITDQVIPFFCRALRLGSTLTVLHLENSILSGRPLIVLVTALKMNDHLRELYLADNRLMPSDGIQLGCLLRYNFRLQLLDVRNNHLQDVGTCHISDGIWEQNLGQGLATLVLWNNQVSYQAMTSMGRALMNTRSLETLNLGHNNITNEGIHRLKEGLLQNKSLLRVGLQAAKLSCEGAVALAEFIAESPRLVRVDIRENDIKTGGLMALSLSLKVSQSVTRIDVDREPKKESSMRDYAEQQRRLLNDISNYMQRNRDLARQREEEEERKRQELAQAQKEVEKAIEAAVVTEVIPQDNETSEDPVSTENSETGLQNGDTSPKRPGKLPIAAHYGSGTLDSPGFVREALLSQQPPAAAAPTPGTPTGSEGSYTSPDLPTDFPPSPIVSDRGHTVLAPVLQDPQITLSPSDLPLGPAAAKATRSVSSQPGRHKFTISPVLEPGTAVRSLAAEFDQEGGEALNPLYSYYHEEAQKLDGDTDIPNTNGDHGSGPRTNTSNSDPRLDVANTLQAGTSPTDAVAMVTEEVDPQTVSEGDNGTATETAVTVHAVADPQIARVTQAGSGRTTNSSGSSGENECSDRSQTITVAADVEPQPVDSSASETTPITDTTTIPTETAQTSIEPATSMPEVSEPSTDSSPHTEESGHLAFSAEQATGDSGQDESNTQPETELGQGDKAKADLSNPDTKSDEILQDQPEIVPVPGSGLDSRGDSVTEGAGGVCDTVYDTAGDNQVLGNPGDSCPGNDGVCGSSYDGSETLNPEDINVNIDSPGDCPSNPPDSGRDTVDNATQGTVTGDGDSNPESAPDPPTVTPDKLQQWAISNGLSVDVSHVNRVLSNSGDGQIHTEPDVAVLSESCEEEIEKAMSEAVQDSEPSW